MNEIPPEAIARPAATLLVLRDGQGGPEVLASELEFATCGSLQLLERWLALSAGERRTRATVPTMRERVWHDE